jgi:hypothetical protein
LSRVSVPTVRWLRQKGRFAPAIKIGRRLVWNEAEVLAWIERDRESHQGFSRTVDAVPGSRISIGVCEVMSGWIHIEDEFLFSWYGHLINQNS